MNIISDQVVQNRAPPYVLSLFAFNRSLSVVREDYHFIHNWPEVEGWAGSVVGVVCDEIVNLPSIDASHAEQLLGWVAGKTIAASMIGYESEVELRPVTRWKLSNCCTAV